MFDVRSFEAKVRVFEFDYQEINTFKFVRCSKNDVRVRSMFDKMVFDPSLQKFKMIFLFSRLKKICIFRAEYKAWRYVQRVLKRIVSKEAA